MVDTPLLKQDFLGNLMGVAQVKNDGQHTHTAAVQFTFAQNGKKIATATGLAKVVPVGQTVAVDLHSTDQWNGQTVTYTFKVTDLY